MINNNSYSESEYYVNKRAVAAHFGVSPRTVERWKEQGCPHIVLGSSDRLVRYKIDEIDGWHKALRESKTR